MLEIDLNGRHSCDFWGEDTWGFCIAKGMKSSSMFKRYLANEVLRPIVVKLLLQSGGDAAQQGRVHLICESVLIRARNCKCPMR